MRSRAFMSVAAGMALWVLPGEGVAAQDATQQDATQQDAPRADATEPSSGQQSEASGTETLPYDHIHLNVPDPAAASGWYRQNFGGTAIDDAPDRLMYGSTRLLFSTSDDAEASAGSSIDHFGFSVPDIETTMDSLVARGATVVNPVREIPGLFKLAFVDDPWGVRIEIVEDPDLLGFHHVHLRGPEPERIFSWLTENFGGERTRLKGRIDAVKYGGDGFDDVWILAQRGASAPSRGRAIDHIGWRVPDLESKMDELEANGVTITALPRPLTLRNDATLYYSFVVGPDGARVELVQR